MPTPCNHVDRSGSRSIVYGSPHARNFHTCQRRPWISATRRHIRQRLKLNDWATKLMLAEATRDFTGSLAPFPMQPGKHGSPLQRAQDIIGWVIAQKRFSAVDILTAALATHVMCLHWVDMPPTVAKGTPHAPYFRAVQIGKAIHKLLRAQVRTYVRDDGRGNVREEVVRYKKALTSRYVCQRLQGLTEAIYGDYLRDHGHAIASQVARSQFMKASRSGCRIVQSSTL